MRGSPARRAARFPAGQPEQGRVSRGGPGGGRQRDRTGSLSRGCGGEEPAPAPNEAPAPLRFSPPVPATAPTPTGNRDAFYSGSATARAPPAPLHPSTPSPLPPPAFFFAPLPAPRLPARPRGARSAAPALPRDPAAAAGRRKDGGETCSAAGECRGKHGGGLGVRPIHPPRTRRVPPRGPLPQPRSGPVAAFGTVWAESAVGEGMAEVEGGLGSVARAAAVFYLALPRWRRCLERVLVLDGVFGEPRSTLRSLSTSPFGRRPWHGSLREGPGGNPSLSGIKVSRGG